MVILVRYAEIGIKGKNREKFERVLVQNIERCLHAHHIPFHGVRRLFGRIIIETDNHCASLHHVFGIASFSQAIRTGATIDEMFAATKPFVESLNVQDSFRISCQRSDKTFPLSSQDVCNQLGDKLRTVTKARVQMKQPTVTVELEIIDGQVYVVTTRTEGPGGMPLGSQGKALVMLEDDVSVLAALLVMKRGCTIIPVVFKDAAADLSLLNAFACGQHLESQSVLSSNELDGLAERTGATAVVLNDNLVSIRQISLKALVLRPLSGMTPEEIAHERQSFEHLHQANGS